jgi:hypothetical protein
MTDGVLLLHTYTNGTSLPNETTPPASKHCQGKERQACLNKSLDNDPFVWSLVNVMPNWTGTAQPRRDGRTVA